MHYSVNYKKNITNLPREANPIPSYQCVCLFVCVCLCVYVCDTGTMVTILMNHGYKVRHNSSGHCQWRTLIYLTDTAEI